ncbi:MAG: signal peptidase I [Elusimicrobia bacterium]|nr:signal peptidase I [Elusimicrobiota bacterium]
MLDKRAATCVWHTLFCALAGFATTMIVTMSIESRARFSASAVGVLSPQELLLSLGGGLICGAWGGWRAWSNGTNQADRTYYHTEDLEWAETVFSAVLLASVMMYFVVQAFKIPSGSMRNTLLEGDHLFVNKFIYGVRLPFTHSRLLPLRGLKRGDIVVFRFPTDDSEEVHCGGIQYGKDFIKRVVGLPGDVIQLKDGVLYRDGERAPREAYALNDAQYRVPQGDIKISPEEYQTLWEKHQLDRTIGDVMRDNFGPVKVPPGAFFAMGDNRDHSCDSRFWGPVADHYLKGKAWVIYWPPQRMGMPK